MKTYLVTGGAGFIGSNYIHYMFEKYGDSIRIINVDVLTYAGNLENLKDIEDKDNYTFIKADICDSEAISKIFAENEIDRVVHFAAESHVDRSIKNPLVFAKTNVIGTLVMLNCAKEAWDDGNGGFKEDKRFLHVSTDEVYGSLPDGDGYFYEDTPYDPHSPYSASKASSDFIVKAYVDTYHFPAIITNCSNNYGPYQFPEKLIPLIINNCLQGKKLPVYGDGKNVRDWLYVKDHCYGILAVLEKGKVGEVQIEVPSFQLNGTFDISLEASGNTTTKLDGDALAVEGASCADGSVYAYITEIPSVASSVAVNDLAVTPAVIEIAVNEEKKLNIIGIKGGLYSNVAIDAKDCVITSDDSSTATVTDGVVKGVQAGTTYINVSYGEVKDVVKVTVA